MNDSNLPSEVREFLLSHIQSVGLLEVLFLFYSKPELAWSPESLCTELRTNAQSAANQMGYLLKKGFIAHEGNNLYSYNPSSDELKRGVQQLHFYYKERPVAVIAYIYEKPREALKGFADAFKLKKE